MNNLCLPPSDEELDDFCRAVVQLAQAREEDIQAVANAPFAYTRLRARLAEAEAHQVARHTPRWAWRWRWAAAFVVLLAMVGVGWRWMATQPAEPSAVQQRVAVVEEQTRSHEKDERKPDAVAKQTGPTPAKKRRAMPTLLNHDNEKTAMEDNEVATDYLPLTFVANSDERSGQVVRVEMPRSAMLALGLPVNNESTSELVKADVLVRDDGLALAIRFVR